MSEPHVLIIGGGVAGMSAGCYARRSGLRTTIIEHNLALGGVCTAWRRGDYVVDGCIHWLTGGPFMRVYEELGIVPQVKVSVLEEWMRYKNVARGIELPITRDLDAMFGRLVDLAPEDREELHRMRDAVAKVVDITPPGLGDEQASWRDRMRALWDKRSTLPAFVHFRKPLQSWCEEHLENPYLRSMMLRLAPPTAPTLFLLMVLGYLERGYLSRPVGGTAAFRDGLERSYRALGGNVMLHSTVDEVLVERDRVRGVRLADGTMIDGDVVVSTASAPETVLRLLGGRYDAAATRNRLETWALFQPIVLASFGVTRPYANMPAMQIVDGIEPFEIGGFRNDSLYLRTCNDDPSFAPPGHTVVQAMVATDYAWWAHSGSEYGARKDAIARVLERQLEPIYPGLTGAVDMVDMATPLTYWHMARAWRGAYEGWMPTPDTFVGQVPKTLHGLDGLYMAGQWVEPGGGIPTAALSGRQIAQRICSDLKVPFFPLTDRH